jgi:hypothetical protein
MTCDTALRNDGLAPIFLYNQLDYGPGADLTIRIEDGRGQVVNPPFLADAVPPPPSAHDVSVLVRLEGAQFFGIRRASSVKDFFPRPGEYRFRVTYSSILYPGLLDEKVRGLNILWRGHPPIVSPWVTIQVTP